MRICLILPAVIWGNLLFAQSTIKGYVKDSSNTGVPFAAVGLLNTKDSSVVKGALTNDSGAYSFTNIKHGSYLIGVEATGYKKLFTPVIKADSGKTIYAPVIQVKTNAKFLSNVNVVANKPFMARKQGEMIFNVENSIISIGKNALEVLNDLPGVSSDDNGNVSVLGKTGILLLVDGKPIHTNLTSYLKSIDASEIETIEVITNPSAKYEAEGQAVINIVLKRNKNLGLSGEIFASGKQGISLGSNESLNINYRTKKWDFFGNVSENIFHNYGTHYTTTTFSSPVSAQEIFYESAPSVYQGTVSSGTVGFDFMPDKRQTITFSVDAFLQPEIIPTYDNTIMHTVSSKVDSSISIQTIRNHTEWQLTPSLNYKIKLDSNGQELNALINYGGPTRTTDLQTNPVYYYNSAGQYLRPSTLNTSNQVQNLYGWYGKLDYTLPLGKNIKLDAGLFDLNTMADNNAQFWNIEQGVQVTDTGKSNQFDFTQNIFAGYINYAQKINEKLDFQAGLRVEQTNNRGTQYVHDTTFTRNYLDFFPSGEINWKVSANHSLSLSYTRRIDRPDFDQVNPFITVIDPYNYTSGNIALMPAISDQYELTYVFKQFLSVTLGYEYWTNEIKQFYFQDNSTFITYSKPVNMNSYKGYNVMVNLSLPITKWWNTVTTVNAYNDNYYDVVSGENIYVANSSISFKTLNIFSWKNKWNAELSFSYTSSDLEGLTITQPIYIFEAGVSRRFYNDRLTIKLGCRDPFMSNKHIMSTVFQNVNVQEIGYWDDRKVVIGLTWKFGKSEYEREENNTTKALGKNKS